MTQKTHATPASSTASTSTASVTQTLDQAMTTFMPYLKESQKNLWITLAIFALSSVLGFIYYQNILGFVMKSMNLSGINLVLTSPTQFIDLAIQTGLIVGTITALPYFAYSILRFVMPALKKKERRIILSFLPLAVILTVIGFAFGIWIEQFVVSIYAKTTIDFQVSNYWDIGHFFAQFMIMGISLALVFQMPIILSVLIRLGAIQKTILVKYRKYVYAGIIVFAAILPPTDMLSMVLIITPLVLLFEGALLLNR